MKITALFAGKPAPLGPRGSLSSIVKQSVKQITVHSDHTEEDEQSNKKLHGGAEKVLHQYGQQGYRVLSEHYPDTDFPLGSIGENIQVEGMNDDNVYIGDTYQFGEVVLQVSAPRAPCSKISQRYGIKNLDRLVGAHGVTGWYYRVLQTGKINVGDVVRLIERPAESVTVGALMKCVFNADTQVQAAQLATLTVLDEEWRQKCMRKARV